MGLKVMLASESLEQLSTIDLGLMPAIPALSWCGVASVPEGPTDVVPPAPIPPGAIPPPNDWVTPPSQSLRPEWPNKPLTALRASPCAPVASWAARSSPGTIRPELEPPDPRRAAEQGYLAAPSWHHSCW